jgi:hypothetical protein
MKLGHSVAALTLLAATALAAQGRDDDRPTLVAKTRLQPPSPADRQRRAAVVVAPYRYGDILWENDRTAHRIYGRPLEAVEPPSSSGIDAWGKAVPWPFMDRQLRTGHQHDYQGEGLDFYNVNASRGAGGLGIWHDNKLWTSRNYARHSILQNGPDVASFEVDYDPWPVDTGRKVWETRRFSLPSGSNFTRMTSTIRSDRPGEIIVGIGIGKRVTSDGKLGTLSVDRPGGKMTWWSPPDPVRGQIGVAVMVDPSQIVGITEDYDNYLILLRVAPGRPFVYYMGSAWTGGREFHDRPSWERHVAAERPDFRVR